MRSVIFSIKASIGKILTESFYKKLGKQLNAQIFIHNGSVDIEWVKIGIGDKPTILFLHGFSDRKENFYFSAKHLYKNFDIIIPDLPGFGNSTSDHRLTYSLDTLFPCETAEFLEQQIKAAQSIIFQDTGHCPHLENPKRFAQELNDCLARGWTGPR